MFGKPELSPIHQTNNVTNTGVILKPKNVRVNFNGSIKLMNVLAAQRGQNTNSKVKAEKIKAGLDWNLNYAIDGV